MLSRGRKARMVPCFGSVEFATCLWIACAILTLAESQPNFYLHGRYGKREPPRAESMFISGSRYGRRDYLQNDYLQKNERSERELEEVAPRVDRFYTGSRYGKRSSPDYRSVSSINRFSAVLDYMDRVNHVDVDRENVGKTNENDLEVLS